MSDASELLQARRDKLERLRADGIEPFPHAFEGVASVADLRARFDAVEAGTDSGERIRVAGRIAARRGQGKAAFLDLVDRTGRIQVWAKLDKLGEAPFELLTGLDLGDIVGVDGEVLRTRRGELSVSAEAVTVLAKSLRPPPEKHHGLQDTETRYRFRELDLISNAETKDLFLGRAKIIASIRTYLDQAEFVEVETPVLQPLYGGALARPFTTHHNTLDRDFFLRVATELYLKRCVVGGIERVYELGKDFRNEGISTKHNPEFTMLEFYEAYADYNDVAERLEEIVEAAAKAINYEGEFDLSRPWKRETLAGAIAERTGIDILKNSERDSLAAAMEQAGLNVPPDDTWPELVDELVSKLVEPKLIQPTFLMDYPEALSPFAKRHREHDGLVERFEAFMGGIEIANAFTELNDPDEQRNRFEHQKRLETAGQEESQPYDEGFVQALEQGMPPTGGLGLGIDRLVMLLSGKSSLREVILFPALRDA